MYQYNRFPSGKARRLRWAASAVAASAAIAATALVLVPAAPAAYPGPNGLIAFRANTDNGSQIFTINPDTLPKVQLTHVDGDAQGAPHWNFDSSMITFEYDPPGACAQVATMDAGGGNLTVLPLADRDVCEGSPTFSAD